MVWKALCQWFRCTADKAGVYTTVHSSCRWAVDLRLHCPLDLAAGNQMVHVQIPFPCPVCVFVAVLLLSVFTVIVCCASSFLSLLLSLCFRCLRIGLVPLGLMVQGWAQSRHLTSAMISVLGWATAPGLTLVLGLTLAPPGVQARYCYLVCFGKPANNKRQNCSLSVLEAKWDWIVSSLPLLPHSLS